MQKAGDNMLTVQCPITWEENSVFPFLAQLIEFKDEPSLCLDFTKAEFVRPFGTILVGDGLKHLVGHRKQRGLATFAQMDRQDRRDGAISYLGHVGFFDFIGLKVGKKLGEATGSGRYAPIAVIHQRDLTRSSPRAPIQQAIEARSDQLATVVFQQTTEQIMVSYCLREVIRNVFEHAQTDTCMVMAQRYSSGEAEIAVLDNGIGIHRSLKKSFDFETVDQALHAAIQPGISRAATVARGDKWSNSGYGLYVLSQLGGKCGQFLIASNGRFLEVAADTQLNQNSGSVAFDGTAIKLVVDLSRVEYFPNLLVQIVKQGEQEQLETTGKLVGASTSSKSLSSRL